MSAWRELVSTALLGTERREPEAAAPLAYDGATPEQRLLGRAAATVVYRRAGARPRGGAEPLSAAAPDTRPLCPEPAALRLAAILAGELGVLLEEWLTLADARGLRVPEELLPALLDAAPRGARDAALAVAGERGRWLAALDERWAWAAATEAAWETGTPEARRAWLRAERGRDPAAARAALEAAWPQEDPRARPGLLAELATGLDPEDEPFLEHALDDRRQEVRATAADLLARLPGSAYSARMAERARPLLEIGRTITAHLPDEPDARDIVHIRPPRGTGERAWWLRQILAGAPLGMWEGEPAELAGRDVRDNLADAVRGGWADAAVRRRNSEWAAALLPVTWEPELVGVLPPPVAERIVTAHLDDPRAAALLRAMERPFGAALSRALVKRAPLTRDLALALDPSVLDQLPGDAPPAVVRLLAFRHDLHRELSA